MNYNNPFINTQDNKRYYTLAYHNKQQFASRVFKATLDLGCTCPNIDGTKSNGGCTYCNRGNTKPSPLSLVNQLSREIYRIEARHGDVPIIAYFQNGSNTYVDLEILRSGCSEVLSYKNVVGISIGTRADCLDYETCSFLWMLSKMTYLTVELGLQTIHDETGLGINRAMTMDEFKEGLFLLKERDIRSCVHIINSLPGETQDMMLSTAKMVGLLHPSAVKIHMLHIMEGTALGEAYKKSPFSLMPREEYVDTVVKQLELLPPDIVIERLTGDGEKSDLIAPEWTRDKLRTLVEIDKAQVNRDSYQGISLL